MKAFQNQPHTTSKGMARQNLYFICPEKWLAENAPSF